MIHPPWAVSNLTRLVETKDASHSNIRNLAGYSKPKAQEDTSC